MSAVGQKVAVIGLGMSCQSSAQIRSHVPLLARLTGDETLKISAMPFDNIICVPDFGGQHVAGRYILSR